MKIYVVMGEDGEYSDWTTWVVKAFSDEQKAEVFAMECEKFMKVKNEKIAAWVKDNPYPSAVSWPNPVHDEYSKRRRDFESSLMSGSPDPEAPVHSYGAYNVHTTELE